MSWQSIHDELDAISRTRALTLPESLKLEEAIKNIDAMRPPQVRDRWTAGEERQLMTLVKSGVSISEAGRRLGKSRSAALGKWGRLAAGAVSP